VRACQFFGFELGYQVLYYPSGLKKLKTVFAIGQSSLYNLSLVYCIMLILVKLLTIYAISSLV